MGDLCYCLDSNKVYTYNINNIDWGKYPIEKLDANKITYKSTTDKKLKDVRYLPTSISDEYTVNNITQFIDIKYNYVKNLTQDKVNKILKK